MVKRPDNQGGPMSGEAVKFERKGEAVNVTVSLPEALKLTTKSGRPGTYGEARVTGPDGKPVRITVNVFQTGKVAPVNLG